MRLLHTGAAGKNTEEFTFTCVHLVVILPISSMPELHMYIAGSLTEFPNGITPPFAKGGGSGHSAVVQGRCKQFTCWMNKLNTKCFIWMQDRIGLAM